MKQRLFTSLTLLSALCISILSPGVTPAASSNTNGQTGIYQPVIDKYAQAVREGWDMQTCAEKGVCYLCYYVHTPEEIGFLLKDFDDDGVSELLIGDASDNSTYLYPGMIYAGYTIKNGEPYCFLESMERETYYICNDDYFAAIESGSAEETMYAFFEPSNKNSFITMSGAIGYDGYSNPDNPWYIEDADGSREYVSENEYEDALNANTYGSTDWKALDDF